MASNIDWAFHNEAVKLYESLAGSFPTARMVPIDIWINPLREFARFTASSGQCFFRLENAIFGGREVRGQKVTLRTLLLPDQAAISQSVRVQPKIRHDVQGYRAKQRSDEPVLFQYSTSLDLQECLVPKAFYNIVGSLLADSNFEAIILDNNLQLKFTGKESKDVLYRSLVGLDTMLTEAMGVIAVVSGENSHLAHAIRFAKEEFSRYAPQLQLMVDWIGNPLSRREKSTRMGYDKWEVEYDLIQGGFDVEVMPGITLQAQVHGSIVVESPSPVWLKPGEEPRDLPRGLMVKPFGLEVMVDPGCWSDGEHFSAIIAEEVRMRCNLHGEGAKLDDVPLNYFQGVREATKEVFQGLSAHLHASYHPAPTEVPNTHGTSV